MCENLGEWLTTLQSEFSTHCNLLNSKSVIQRIAIVQSTKTTDVLRSRRGQIL